MKTIRAMIALLLVATFLCGFALAEDEKESIETGVWYAVGSSDEQSYRTCFNLTVNKESILKLEWKGCPGSIGMGFDYYMSTTLAEDKAKGCHYWILEKGTYPISVRTEESPKAKVRFTLEKPTFKRNYNRKKAITLKKGTTVMIAQTVNQCYPRWYRIKLTKKQVITFSTSSVQLYDKDMNRVPIVDGKTRDWIQPGTYYAVVGMGYINYLYQGGWNGMHGYVLNIGPCIAFSWK